jgi:hypothetical protein
MPTDEGTTGELLSMGQSCRKPEVELVEYGWNDFVCPSSEEWRCDGRWHDLDQLRGMYEELRGELGVDWEEGDMWRKLGSGMEKWMEYLSEEKELHWRSEENMSVRHFFQLFRLCAWDKVESALMNGYVSIPVLYDGFNCMFAHWEGVRTFGGQVWYVLGQEGRNMGHVGMLLMLTRQAIAHFIACRGRRVRRITDILKDVVMPGNLVEVVCEYYGAAMPTRPGWVGLSCEEFFHGEQE